LLDGVTFEWYQANYCKLARFDFIAEEGSGRCMTLHEIRAAQPALRPADHLTGLIDARQRMIATGQWSASQFMGRRWPIGCVALEITQRCNLDCTACYLSEHSEAVKDVPIEEVFRRIDMIFDYYGLHTDVQVTGGDPTLRRRDELVAIVRRIHEKGMRPTLFTNGIRAKRDLLQELAVAGLVDVAFHVDMTQQRSGYGDEIALNALRQEYIDRCGAPRVVPASGRHRAGGSGHTGCPDHDRVRKAPDRAGRQHAAFVRYGAGRSRTVQSVCDDAGD
jgi:hypothetical protein